MLVQTLLSQFVWLKSLPLTTSKLETQTLLFLTPVTEQEIEIIIQSLNLRKAIGPYSIPVFLLKILSRHIAKPLSIIVNQSFQTGIFPDALKVGKVTPFDKKDSCDNPSNYMSILSVFSKIIEKNLFYDCLYGFLDKFELLCTLYSLVFVKSTLPLMLSYLLQSQLNIPLTIVNMVVEYFWTCKKHLRLLITIFLWKNWNTIELEEMFWIGSDPISVEGQIYVTVNGHVSDCLLFVVFHKALFLGLYCFWYMLMIYQVSQKFLNFNYLLMIQVFTLNQTTF